MSNVPVTIGSRAYTVACTPGEEDHLRGLGQLIDSRLQAVPGVAGHSKVRRLLYTTLVLADERHELREQADVPPTAPTSMDEDPTELLEQLATRLESLADVLEQPGTE